ncbi:RICIN domain-containing protein [Kribbella italica]|uniref:Ricin B lectin domain-containing protein n=1 Tax=Kribbella italica TaxID=1540520 RepID=A0A7W9MYC7_9ACTN|nr:RICIN domain-containing protein [Kribbella italica]MBB5841006.1 hypothetical protein [Kribbella italica]
MSKLRALVGSIVMASALTVPIASAQAMSPADGHREAGAQVTADPIETYKNRHTGQRLDDNLATGNVRTMPTLDANQQKWRVRTWRDKTVRLQNVHTGKCVADGGRGRAVPQTCNSSEAQSWEVIQAGSGYIKFRNEAYGYCLHDTYANDLQLKPCAATTSQHWN